MRLRSCLRRSANRALLVIVLSSVASCSDSPNPIAPDPDPALPLTIACPQDVEATLTEGTDLPLSFGPPTIAGGDAPVTVSCGPASGSMFSPGTSRVTCTAVDSGGRQASCSFGVTVTRAPRLAVTTFLAFGDSVTEGKLSLSVNLLIDSPAHSYPAALGRALMDRYPSQTFSVLNAGFGGERVAASGDRFTAALREHRPGAVLLLHGINDLNGDGLPGVQQAVDGLEELVKSAVASGTPTFVATLPPLGPGPKAFCPECVIPFNDRVHHMVPAKGAVLVDVFAAWGGRSGLMGADGIHPTEAGYETIATAFFEAIGATLETIQP